MSAMKDLEYDIQELFIDGHSPKMIAVILECPLSLVGEVLESFGVASAQQEEFNPFKTINS